MVPFKSAKISASATNKRPGYTLEKAVVWRKGPEKVAAICVCPLPHPFFETSRRMERGIRAGRANTAACLAGLLSLPCCLRKRSPTDKWKGLRDIHMHTPSCQTPSGFRWLALGRFGLSWRIETWEPFVSTPFWGKCHIFHLKSPFKKKNMFWKEDTIWKPSHLMESL